MNRKIIKLIYLVLAFLSAGLGIIGVILPVLPTTPFLLLASFLFAKSSDRVHNWFIRTKLYEKHLHSFVETRTMTMKTKLFILLPASLMLITAFIICPIWHGRVLIAAAFLFKYYYFIFRIKTIQKTPIPE